ncbi:MAG: glycosyltransferase family 39 protein [Burkholderiales bacterium]|nr:glycosyltransferase family 39 protein [Burkholderiales bacterium]
MTRFRRFAGLSGRRLVLAGLALLVFGLLWFGNLEYRDLVDPDEGRYAEIPREMAASGDWVTPRLNDLKYFEKPPLQYWATAAFYRVFGVDEWVGRLWPALTGLAGIALLFAAGARLYSRRVGVLAALVVTGMVAYVLYAHALTLDMGLTLFQCAAVLGFAVAQRDSATARERQAWMLGAWAAVAAAVLSKGLVGILLPAVTVGLYVLVHRDFALLRRLEAGKGIVLFVVLAAPWFVVVSTRNPEFARFFFWHEHFERFLLPEHHRPGAWWYFLPVLAMGATPWLGVLAWSAPRWWGSEPGARFRATRFLALWCAVVLVFFSASSSKLAPYVLPVFPVLALLVASKIDEFAPRTLALLLAVFAVPIVLGAWLVPPRAVHRIHLEGVPLYAQHFLPWIVAAGGILGAGLLAAGAIAWRGWRGAAVATASFASLVAVTLAMTGHQTMSPVYSTEQSFERMRHMYGEVPRNVPFFSVGMYDQGMPFELGRPLVLVAYRDEFALGLDAEPQKALPTLDDFRAAWRSLDAAYAVMRPATYEMLRDEGLPMTLLVIDPRRAIVRR